MTKLAGKVALVVGAGSPLGSAAAKLLAAEGAWVAANDWSPSAAEKVATAIKSAGGKAEAYAADASKKLTFQTALERLLESRGKIDILLNATSVQPQATLLEMDEWDWRRALDLNLSSVFLSMQSVARVMRELGGGLMVNLVADEDELASASYLTAAAGVEDLSAAAAEEFAAYNIQVHFLRTASSVEAIRKLLFPLLLPEPVEKA